MNASTLDALLSGEVGAVDSGDGLAAWIGAVVVKAPNKALLQKQLHAVEGHDALLRFLHRFLLFNDSLAARVPFLAGLIHLTPRLFMDPAAGVEFCRLRNGTVAAYVAQAASDEYHMTPEGSMVHQHLSQEFFRGCLEYYRVDPGRFDADYPVTARLDELLGEARSKYFEAQGAERVFACLGFHIGLEFFANEEFNLVDQHLRSSAPELVAALERAEHGVAPYTWLAIHTVVEVQHYRAGLEAVRDALRFYSGPMKPAEATDAVRAGFTAFVDLQRRYYEAILADA